MLGRVINGGQMRLAAINGKCMKMLVAGAYKELKPPTLSFRYRLAVQRRIPLILRPRRPKGAT